jgi:Uri superfamily endonuclease
MNIPLSSPGTYALELRVTLPVTRKIGALGLHFISPGSYYYIGSAFGPGGLRGRLSHHLKPIKKPHWHIDYLHPDAEIQQIWYTYSVRCEHAWAAVFQSFPDSQLTIPGFGSSDCSCPAHLFYFAHLPENKVVQKSLAMGMSARRIQCLPITMVRNLHTSRL